MYCTVRADILGCVYRVEKRVNGGVVVVLTVVLMMMMMMPLLSMYVCMISEPKLVICIIKERKQIRIII